MARHAGRRLNREGAAITNGPVSAEQLAGLIKALQTGTISGRGAKVVFDALVAEWKADPRTEEVAGAQIARIIGAKGLQQISDSGAIDKLVAEVIAANPTQVEQFRAGKQQVLGFLVGQVMKASRGKANPQQVNDALRKQLGLPTAD